MHITRVELENVKSYRRLAIDLRRGTTAIQGANGAGKTTLVEAIGFALFDYLPYKQGQFVREGEKAGTVVVHLVGNDDRLYEVERRCGASAHWTVYDCEADYRVEQRADVVDKLHDLFGIDHERPLETLFKDALGVPQGTFTAIFLEAAGKRKNTFDELLQIEDYKLASDYLLDVQKHYQGQAQLQQSEIQRLGYETRDLATWQDELREARLLDQQQTEQVATLGQHLAELETRFDVLKQQRDDVRQLLHRYEQHKTTHQAAQQRLHDRQQELDSARAAHQAVEASSADYQRYQQAETALKGLRQDERLRNKLRQQQGDLQSARATASTRIENLRGRLAEVASARQRVIDLSLHVEQQVELERQREDLTRRVTRYDELVKEGRRLAEQHKSYQRQQGELQQRIVAIEPLQSLAATLTERVEALAQLRAQANERGALQRQLQEKREQLRLKNEEREKAVDRMRKAENALTKIEAHRAEAEELPSLVQQHTQLSEQRYRLEGNIEGYTRSREQSRGGQCPLLQQTCLNIQQKGLLSLESYFDGLLADDNALLATITRQQDALTERMAQIKKYAEALDRRGQYTDQRDNYAEHLQRLALEITRLERDVTGLEQDLEELKKIDQQIVRAEKARKESQDADQQVRELEGLRMRMQQLQEQAEQCGEVLKERRQEVQELIGSGEQLAAVKAELEALNDPLGQTRAQHEIIKQEPTYLRQLDTEEAQRQTLQEQIQSLDVQLQGYAALDVHIGEQEAYLQQCLPGYTTYLKNEQAARLLPQRQQAHQQTLHDTEQAQQELEKAEEAYRKANDAFHEEELIAVETEIKQRRNEQQTLAEAIRQRQKTIQKLERDIQRAEALLLELEAAQQEQRTLEELGTMTEQFRKLYKEAAPQVLKAILADISAEANRIFGEIMGDRSAQLSWQNDYEIVLRRQSVNRTFAQLSGGEQMSAALSVRLALLKKLSTLNIAFFDEPTQNMDELRRMNLAEQIRRVRGFDQLIVISHDDTFEQGLDSLVRLHKVNGETHQEHGDEATETEKEQVQVNAS